MAKSRRQRESDMKLARQGLTIVALFVGVLVWGSSHSLMAGVISFGVALVGIEFLLVAPGLVRRSRFQRSGIADIDSLNWSEFEEFIAALFRAKGYRTRLTPTYDQGGDVIVEGNGEHIVVQAKHRTEGDIGNKAVQEAVAAVGYYKATRAILITNRYFTRPAVDLAKANNVELWDRDRLSQEMLKAYPSSPVPVEASAPASKRGFSLASSPSTTCPRCGAPMVQRNSKYGPFWGCSTFPRCWGTRQS
jgi:restriction system protein